MRRPSRRLHRADYVFQASGGTARKGYQREALQWSKAYRALLQVARATGKRKATTRPVRDRVFHQRVFVKVGYVPNKRRGQWRARGIYIQRESAGFGFGPQGVEKCSQRMNEWQREGDPRLWWMIISPEHGEKLELDSYTRALMQQLESDLGHPLEWTAAVHKNTEHHHVHVAIRGVSTLETGRTQEVRFEKDYIKRGMRERAQVLATAKLGYRLEHDVILDQRRMVLQPRYTDLDRNLRKRAKEDHVYVNPEDPALKGMKLATEQHCLQRLHHLETLGLASQIGRHLWHVEHAFERALRSIQKAHDRLHMQNNYGVMSSDPDLPVRYSKWSELTSLEGRVLLHGQDDNREDAFMLFEEVNGTIHYLPHRQELEDARRQGLMQPGSYVAMRVVFAEGQKVPTWIIEDYGLAEQALENEAFLDGCLRRGVAPKKIQHLGRVKEAAGWLGDFRRRLDAIRNAARTAPLEPRLDLSKKRSRGHAMGLGR